MSIFCPDTLFSKILSKPCLMGKISQSKNYLTNQIFSVWYLDHGGRTGVERFSNFFEKISNSNIFSRYLIFQNFVKTAFKLKLFKKKFKLKFHKFFIFQNLVCWRFGGLLAIWRLGGDLATNEPTKIRSRP